MRRTVRAFLKVGSCLLASWAVGPLEARELELVLPSGQKAAHFRVSLENRAVTVRADANGRIVLEPEPDLPVRLVAVSPDGQVWGPIELEAWPEQLVLSGTWSEQVTVLGGVAPRTDVLPAGASTLVTEEQLGRLQPVRAYQALEGIPGAGWLGDGADSVPALRNLARGRTLILLDGARVTAERRAGPSATFLEAMTLEAIEVVRGPGSVVYGSDAFGGVLHLISREPPSGPITGRLDAEGGALAGQGQALLGSASGSLGATDLALQAYGRSLEEMKAAGGREIFNSSFEARGGSLQLRRAFESGLLRASLAFDRVRDLGKASIDSRQIRSFYPQEDSDRWRVDWAGSLPGGRQYSILASGSRYDLTLDRDRAPTATSNRRLDRALTKAEDAHLRAGFETALARGRLRTGLDLAGRMDLEAITEIVRFGADSQTIDRIDRTVSIERAKQIGTGLFWTYDRPLGEPVTLGAGLRADRIDTENRGGFFGDRQEDRAALSGNLSVSWRIRPDWTLVGQVARGFRSPTLSDRYFRGPSGRGFVTGNPELDPETSLQYDLRVEGQRRPLRWALNAYRYEIRDLVERYRQGDNFFFRNRGRAVLQGLEAEARGALAESWSWSLAASWAEGRTDAGVAPDDVAAPRLSGSLDWRRRSWEAGVAVTAVARHHDPGPTEVERPGFVRWDLSAAYRPSPSLAVRLQVRNLLDRDYFASPDETADRAQGRSATVSLSWKFPERSQ